MKQDGRCHFNTNPASTKTNIPKPKAIKQAKSRQIGTQAHKVIKNDIESPSKDQIVKNLTAENHSLKAQLKQQEAKLAGVTETYKQQISDMKHQLFELQSQSYIQSDTSDQDAILKDYQDLITVLHENNLKLRKEFMGYRKMSDEKSIHTSQVLQNMIDYLYSHAKRQPIKSGITKSEFKKRA